MKRIFIFFILLVLLTRPCFATEYVIDGDSGDDSFNTEDYMPKNVLDLLKNNGIETPEKVNGAFVIKLLFEHLAYGADKFSEITIELIGIAIIISIIKRINDKSGGLLIFNLISCSVVCLTLLSEFSDICIKTNETLSSISELLGALLPSFVSVYMLGGEVMTSAASVTSFGAVLAILEIFLSGIITGMVSIMVVISVFERLSPSLNAFGITKTVKKYAIMLISFVTTVMLTVLSYQNIISARVDSMSSRTVRFAAANFIPIVGNAVGESLKTVSKGVSYLKASVGASSSLALFLCVLPFICELVILKLTLSFISVLFSVLGCEQEGAYISTSVGFIDILLSIIICCSILSFLLIYLFTIVTVG